MSAISRHMSGKFAQSYDIISIMVNHFHVLCKAAINPQKLHVLNPSSCIPHQIFLLSISLVISNIVFVIFVNTYPFLVSLARQVAKHSIMTRPIEVGS